MKQHTDSIVTLKRETEKIIFITTRASYEAVYANKTTNYINIKFSDMHLTNSQLSAVTQTLKKLFPNRFLKVYNSTAVEYYGSRFFGTEDVPNSYKVQTVLVRFSKSPLKP